MAHQNSRDNVRLLARLARLSLVAMIVLGALAHSSARAQVGSERYSSIIVDVASGNILSSVAADEPRFPASLTKMMTLYMLFEGLRDRRVSLDQIVPVSAHTASMSPSKLGLTPGMFVTVEQCLLGLVTKSANDAAAALGELLGGDEDRFAQLMTLRARALGMTHTTFRNASGLPDWDQVTTARDLAILARHLVQDFPVQYRYFSTPSFVFRGRLIPNHDRMLQTYPGADGMKTGWIEASGHNLVTSAVHGDIRLVGVVLGAGSSAERDGHMAALLDQGFDRLGAPLMVARHEVSPPSYGFGIIAAAQAAPRPAVRLAGARATIHLHSAPHVAPAAVTAPARRVLDQHADRHVRPIVAVGQAPAPHRDGSARPIRAAGMRVTGSGARIPG